MLIRSSLILLFIFYGHGVFASGFYGVGGNLFDTHSAFISSFDDTTNTFKSSFADIDFDSQYTIRYDAFNSDYYEEVKLNGNLVAYFDDSGTLTGGNFSLYGILPSFGISDYSLLATGNVVNATASIPDSFQLIPELFLNTTNHHPLIDVNDYGVWAGHLVKPAGLDVSRVFTDSWSFMSGSYTSSHVYFLNDAIKLPEPFTPLLLATGLAVFIRYNKRKHPLLQRPSFK